MKELQNIMVAMIVVGILMTGLFMFINPFLDHYSVDDPGDMEAYNKLADMTSKTSQVEDDLKGIDENTSGGALSVFIVKSAYKSIVDGLRSLPTLGGLFIDIGNDLGVPAGVMMGVMSIIILGIVFSLGYLFLQVIK